MKKTSNRSSSHDSERTRRLAQLVGLVETMAAESGAPDGFDAAAWVGEWLARPHSALGGQMPADLLDTTDGLQMLLRLLKQSQTGAYA